MSQRPLIGPEAQLLDLLIRVCRIGRRQGTWNTDDVRRVTAEHLHARYVDPPGLPARAKPMRRPAPPAREYDITDQPPLDIDLTRRQAQVLDGMVAGWDKYQIGDALGITSSTASNAMSAVARALGAVDRHHAVQLVKAGAVAIHIKDRRAA